MGKDDLVMLLEKGLSPFITDDMFESAEPINLDELLSIAL